MECCLYYSKFLVVSILALVVNGYVLVENIRRARRLKGAAAMQIVPMPKDGNQ